MCVYVHGMMIRGKQNNKIPRAGVNELREKGREREKEQD